MSRRIFPLAFAGFFGAFCNSGFNIWAVLIVLSRMPEYLKKPFFLLTAAALYVLPVLLLPVFSGFVSDRLPKRYVVIAARMLEMLLLALPGYALHRGGSDSCGYWLLGMILLLSVVRAFGNPALDGLLPETFTEPELSAACGKTFSASVSGFIAGIVIIPCGFYLGAAWNILLLAGICGFYASVKIVPVITPVQRRRELAYSFRDTLRAGFRTLGNAVSLRASAIGEICFTGLGITALPLLVLFGRNVLHMENLSSIILLLLAPGLGLVAGCFCAGILSSNKIELGLIPIGAMGITASLPFMVFFPGTARQILINFPGGLSTEILFYAGAWCWAVFAGFSGGLLLIPLRSYIFQRIRPEARGIALALKKAASFAVCSGAMLLVILLSPAGENGVSGTLLHDKIPQVPFQILFGGFALTVFIFTLLAMWQLPNFMLRFIILTLGHSFYRVRVSGAENIPERGPALLLCNHVSAIDSILVSACTSRQIRFLLYDDYFSLPLVGFIARMTGFFRVPGVGKIKSMGLLLKEIRGHLANNGLVCVFPEGRLTGNGLVGEFKQGYEKMLPSGVDVPIIPVNISFAWGSVFSNFFSRPGLKRKISMPFFSAVSFGKPLAHDTPVFEIRQKIIELGAEAGLDALPGEKTLHYRAVELARKNWWKPLFSDSNGRRYSAFALVSEAVVLSRIIRRRIASEERHVGILLPNGTDLVKTLLAILMADRVPVPLNYSSSQEVLDISIESAQISMVITARDFLKKIRVSPGGKAAYLEDMEEDIPLAGKILAGVGMLVLPSGEFMNMISPLTAFDLKQDAVLLFSSGSTGNPKGIRLSHHNLNSNARSVASGFAVDGNDLIVGNLPLFHSFGLNVCFWLPWLYGCAVVYTPNPLDAVAVCGAISRFRATMLFATPSFLQKYLRRCRGEDLISLRVIATGAEKLRDDIAAKVRELTGGRLEVVECYGCTELSPVVSVNLARNIAETGMIPGCRDSIGIALENVSVRILDPLTFKPVEPGEEGILCVKGALVMQGYLNNEALTAGMMTDGYYKTGDIARMDQNGYIHICGRLSRFSKIAGEMVPHEMVERIINEMCSGENRVVAVGSIPDPVKGEALLVLYTDEMPFSPEEIVGQLRERSISNLWIPKVQNFHRVEQLPLLGSGKPDLSLLREIAEKIASSGNGD